MKEGDYMFYFDASKFMTKREFDEFVEVEKQLFNDSKNSVIEEYLPLLNQEQLSDSKEYDSFRKSYRKCIIDMFNRVIKYFDKYFKVKYMVLLEGSYGRDSDRICSDLDYTLVYDEDKDNYMVTLEDFQRKSFIDRHYLVSCFII